MAWRDNLRPASFRGVPFKVDTSDLSGGRAVVDHEFPFRDTEPYVEDLGKQGRVFAVSGYLVGDDYFTQKESLLSALEEPGPGELVHPYWGTHVVVCASFRITERKDDGRMATFVAEFRKTSEPLYPADSPDNQALVDAAADAAQAASEDVFESRFSVQGAAQFVVDAAREQVEAVADLMDSLLGPMQLAAEDLAELKRDIDNLYLDADALIRAPNDLADRYAMIIRNFGAMPAVPDRSLNGLKRLITGIGETRRPTNRATTMRRRQDDNQTALLGYFEQSAIIEAARVLPAIRFGSYDEAVASRDEIVDLLDEQAEATTDDTLFRTLTDLRVEVVKAVPGEANDLARLIQYTPRVSLPALVIANELYGDATMEADIVARNRIRRPGFTPGGQPLQVISDE